ncbi:MAG: FISUMP domain-containing protein [Bacteroidales bacterium]|nr:FISUMP domain-containing protein [Bacteroidales bacterium]
MKTKIVLSVVALAVMASVYGQNPAMILTFNAVNATAYVQPDSIKVMNRTRGGDTVLYYPDTVLALVQVGIHDMDNDKEHFQVFQNYPNPVMDQTIITLYVPEKDKVDLTVTDIHGRQVIHTRRMLDQGYHSFRFTPGTGRLFFFTTRWKGSRNSIRIMNSASASNRNCSLEYMGIDKSPSPLKTTEAVQTFTFSQGDTLLYIGYAGTLQSGKLDTPGASSSHTFQFATNIPCPGTPAVTYEGQVYNTIQIFSQCWLKENLNVGSMINGSQNQTNNGILEKYCHSNNPDSCIKYGGLYQWDEMMQYVTQQGSRGICPPDWLRPHRR